MASAMPAARPEQQAVVTALVNAPQPQTSLQPPILPPHLQHAVHRALGDLQASRLLYPQRCAAAEASGGSDRADAERRVLAALGGAFDYAAARAQLEEARRVARRLGLGRGQRQGGQGSGGAEQRAPVSAAPQHPPDTTAASAAHTSSADDGTWHSFEELTAAVSAEVDRRIAAARLQPARPSLPARLSGPRRSHRGQAGGPAEPDEHAAGGLSNRQASRQPFGSVQESQQQQQRPGGASAGLQERKRERERSPHAPAASTAAAAAGPDAAQASRQGRREQKGVSAGAAAASSPATKRQKPHVAFGTRFDAPRPAAARAGKPVRLDAATAPTPPALPPVQAGSEEGKAAGQRAARAQDAGAAPARSELLRALAATFAARGSEDAGPSVDLGQAEAVESEPLPAADAASSGQGQLQRMLEQLTAAVQGLSMPAAQPSIGGSAAVDAPAAQTAPSLQAVLREHGIEAASLGSTGDLLQAVLDRMDEIAERASEPPSQQQQPAAAPPAPAGRSAQAPPSAALARGEQASQLDASAGAQMPAKPVQQPLAEAPSPPACASRPGRSEAAQLCRQLSALLDSSENELLQVQRQLEVARKVEAALEKVEAAAVDAALGAAEAACQQAAARQAACRGSSTGQQEPREPIQLGPQQGEALPAAQLESAAEASGAAGESSPAPAEQPPAEAPAVDARGEPTSTAQQPEREAALAAPPSAAEGKEQQKVTAAAAAGPEAASGAEQLAAASQQNSESALIALGWPVAPPAAFGGPALPFWMPPLAAPGLPWQQALGQQVPAQQQGTAAPLAAEAAAHVQSQGAEQQQLIGRPSAAASPASSLHASASYSPCSSSLASRGSNESQGLFQEQQRQAEKEQELERRQQDEDRREEEEEEGRQRLAAAEERQRLVEELAEQGIGRYEQHMRGMHGAPELAAAAPDPWELAMQARGASSGPGLPAEPPCGFPAEPPCGPTAAAAGTGPGAAGEAVSDPAAGEGGCGAELPDEDGWAAPADEEEEEPAGLAVPASHQLFEQEAGLAVPMPRPPAPASAAAVAAGAIVPASQPILHLPFEPQPRPPYNPLRFAEGRAAAARREADAASWRQLRQRVDLLALWHEYASELGLETASPYNSAAGQAQQPAGLLAVPPGGSTEQRKGRGEAERPTASAAVVSSQSPGLAVPVLQPAPPAGMRLWRPAQGQPGGWLGSPLPGAGQLTPERALSLGTPAGAGVADSVDDSSACLSSSSSGTPVSASSLAASSDASSLGVAGRHKARALRFRLLRRQLAAAAGLEHSPALTEAGSALLSPTDDSRSSFEASELGSECSTPLAAAAAGLAAAAAAAGPRVVVRVPPRGAGGSCAVAGLQGVMAANEGVAEALPQEPGELPATPAAVALALAAAEAAAAAAGAEGTAPGVAPSQAALRSNLADHLSDATPSSLASAGPAHSSGGSPGSSPLGEPSLGVSVDTSSCSTLQEAFVSKAAGGGPPASTAVERSGGDGGHCTVHITRLGVADKAVDGGGSPCHSELRVSANWSVGSGRASGQAAGRSALQALKSRMAEGWRSDGSGSLRAG